MPGVRARRSQGCSGRSRRAARRRSSGSATHPASPSRLDGQDGDLREWLDREGEPLPFLFKVLAAESPLSLQAHPDAATARAGFDRENALGIGLDDPARNYRDPFPKPELIVAVEDGFHALCGFRPVAETRADLELLIELGAGEPVTHWLGRLRDDRDIRPVFEWLISRGPGVDELIAAVVAAGRDAFPTVGLVADAYPGDPGIAIALMLHDVELRAGEALYLAAGNIHAYLSGLGMELMRSSDNVLRGGLTPKHVDVGELLAVLDFAPGPVPSLPARSPSPGVTVWDPGIGDFRLARIDGQGALAIGGPAIALCVAGEAELTGASGTVALPRGSAVYAQPG